MAFWKNKTVVGVCIALSSVLLFSTLAFTDVLERWQTGFSDRLYETRPPLAEIILVAIDESTLADLGGYITWNRSYFAQVLENLNKYDPKVVGFDFFYRSPKDSEGDNRFAKALNESGDVVLGLRSNPLRYDDRGYYVNPSLSNPIDLTLEIFSSSPHIFEALLNIRKDDDGSIRYYLPVIFDEHRQVFDQAFAFTVAQKYLGISETPQISPSAFLFGESTIPLENGEMLINFATNPDNESALSYSTIPFSHVYNENYRDPSVLFKDKIVLIGPTAPSLKDTFTILNAQVDMPGVEIHANAVQTILEQKFLRNMSFFEQILLIFTLSLLAPFVFLFTKIRWSALFLVGFSTVYGFLAPFAFEKGLILDLIHPYLALLFVFIASYVYRYLTEFKAKIQLKGAFSRYVNPNIVNQIMKNPSKLSLGGSKRNITVLFTDIAHFTTISEQLKPESLVALLNEYLEAMSSIIMAEGGTLDKYEGDAIMAFFGAPITQEDHALRACRAALNMRQKISELHEKWKQDPPLPGGEKKPLFDFRCGLSSGDAIVGNIGSLERLEYTAMGDIVNLGSRLEGANKKYSTNIMVSESTYLPVKDHFEVRELDILRVVGKKQSILVYELLNYKDQLTDDAAKLLQLYNEGVQMYHARKFADALAKFEEILKVYPEDGPSKLYRQRCEVLRDFPPKDDWDGVFEMGTK